MSLNCHTTRLLDSSSRLPGVPSSEHSDHVTFLWRWQTALTVLKGNDPDTIYRISIHPMSLFFLLVSFFFLIFLHYPILGSHSGARGYGFSRRGVDDYDTAPPPTSWESTALRENYYLKTSRRMTTISCRGLPSSILLNVPHGKSNKQPSNCGVNSGISIYLERCRMQAGDSHFFFGTSRQWF